MTPTEAGPQINPTEFLEEEENFVVEEEDELAVDHENQYLNEEEDQEEQDVYEAVEQMFPKSDDYSELDNNDTLEELYTPRKPAEIGDVLYAKRQEQNKRDELNERIATQEIEQPPREIQDPNQQITTLGQATPKTPEKEIDLVEGFKGMVDWVENDFAKDPTRVLNNMNRDFLRFVAFEQDPMVAQAAKNVVKKIGDNFIRLKNSLLAKIPEENLTKMKLAVGPELGSLLYESDLSEFHKLGGEFKPSTTTAKIFMYPTEVALAVIPTALAGAAAAPVVGTAGAFVGASAMGAGMIGLMETPTTTNLTDAVHATFDIPEAPHPLMSAAQLDFMRSNGKPMDEKIFAVFMEEFFLAMGTFGLGNVAKKAVSPAIKAMAKRKATLLKDAMVAKKSSVEATKLIGARATGDPTDLAAPNSILVEKAFGSNRKGAIPQFTLKPEDPFVMDTNPLAQMARDIPKDVRGRSVNITTPIRDEMYEVAQLKGSYNKKLRDVTRDATKGQIEHELVSTVNNIEIGLDKMDDILSKPGLPKEKGPPVIPGEKQDTFNILPPSDVDDLTITVLQLEDDLHKLQAPFDVEIESNVVNPMYLSNKGQGKLRNLHEKLDDDINKNYFAHLTTDDLVLPYTDKRDPSTRTTIDVMHEGHITKQQAWETGQTGEGDIFKPGEKVVINEAVTFIDDIIKNKKPFTPDKRQTLEGIILSIADLPYINSDRLNAKFGSLLRVDKDADVVSIGVTSTKRNLKELSTELKSLVSLMDAHYKKEAQAYSLLKNMAIDNMSAADWLNKTVRTRGPIIGVRSLNIRSSIDNMKLHSLIDPEGLESSRFPSVITDKLDSLSSINAIGMLARQRSDIGRKLLRYDAQIKKEEVIQTDLQNKHQKEINKMSLEVEKANLRKEKLQDKYDGLKAKNKEYIAKVRAGIAKKNLRYETRLKMQEDRLKGEIEVITKDVEIRDKKLAELTKVKPTIYDIELAKKDMPGKFVTIRDKKVWADVSKLKTKEDFALAVEDVKAHLLENIKNEPRYISSLLKAGWQKGEMLPPELRNQVAKRLGLMPEELQQLSPHAKDRMQLVEETWDALDMAAVMRIVDSSWDRIVLLAKLAGENSKLTPDELLRLGIDQKSFDLMRKERSLEAVNMFKQEFEKFFYEIYPMVFRGMEGTPTLPIVSRFMEDRLGHLGKIEDLVMSLGRRGGPHSVEGTFQIAAEVKTIHQLGGKQGLLDFTKHTYAKDFKGPLWERIANSALFIRSVSMLSSIKTPLRIMSGGVLETANKVLLEYPIEMGVRYIKGRTDLAQVKRELGALHKFGHINAAIVASKLLVEHMSDFSQIVNLKKHYKREFPFTKPKVDPSASKVDVGDRDLMKEGMNPLRYDPENQHLLGMISDIIAAAYETPYRGIDTVDDVTKAVNIAYRIPILSMRQADLDTKAAWNKHLDRAERAVKTKYNVEVIDKDGKVVFGTGGAADRKAALKEYNQILNDFNADEYRENRFGYYMTEGNATPEMIEDYTRHYKQVTLLEDLSEHGALGRMYKAWKNVPGATYLWPFLLTSLNSYKRNIETSMIWSLPFELAHLANIIHDKAQRNKMIEIMDQFPPGTPARIRYEQLVKDFLPNRAAERRKEGFNIIDYSWWDESIPARQEQRIARVGAGTVALMLTSIGAGALYFTADDDSQRSNYHGALRSLNVSGGSKFVKTGQTPDGKDTGIWVPIKRDEPLGAFVHQAVRFHDLHMYLTAEQYGEAMAMLTYLTVEIYGPDAIVDFAKDVSFLGDVINGNWTKGGRTKFANTVKKKLEMYFGAAVSVPVPKGMEGILPDYARSEGRDDTERTYVPLGMKGLINDLRMLWEEEGDEFVKRQVAIDKGIYDTKTVAHQRDLRLWEVLTDALYKSYRNKAPGLSDELEPALNWLGQEMRVAPEFGVYTLGAYLLPSNGLGSEVIKSKLRRPDMEAAPGLEILRTWERADYYRGERLDPTPQADALVNESVLDYSADKSDRRINRIFAEQIRYGYTKKWQAIFDTEEAWHAKPIFSTIAKTSDGKRFSAQLSHAQKNAIIKLTNTHRHEKYNFKTMKEALYDEITQGYPSLAGPTDSMKQYNREARMQKMDDIIADYAEAAKKEFLEAFEPIKEGLDLQGKGR